MIDRISRYLKRIYKGININVLYSKECELIKNAYLLRNTMKAFLRKIGAYIDNNSKYSNKLGKQNTTIMKCKKTIIVKNLYRILNSLGK